MCLVHKELEGISLGVVFCFLGGGLGFCFGRGGGEGNTGRWGGEFACTCSNFYALKRIVRRAHHVRAYAIITKLLACSFLLGIENISPSPKTKSP